MVRPRSVRAHDAVLDAALRLFADRGIDATSMDAIAEASGVSKATIYKHWPDKDALCVEVMARLLGRDTVPPDFDSGDLRTDLIAVLSHQPPEQHAELRTRMMPHLMVYGARNPAFGVAWRSRVLEPPRIQLTHALARGIARGQLPRTLNLDLAVTLLHGPMMYAHMIKLMNREPPADLQELVVDAFMRSYGLDAAGGAGRLASTERTVQRKGRRAVSKGAGTGRA
jgi:AcrR family transcriptional regulator